MVNAANNRYGVPAGQTGVMQYDAMGNLYNDTYSGTGARTFDGENRMVTATNTGGQQSLYTYDADGRRVRRSSYGQETWQVYGLDGELLAEYAANAAPAAPQGEYGYRNGQLLVTAAPGADLRWLVADHLGTPRIVADRTGSLAGITRHDYLPFGEELFAGTGNRTTQHGYQSSDNIRQQFTKYERDDETGLDFAQARYYASTQGRFTSPDPTLLSVNALNPQSWNRYAYVLNDPLVYVDPLGLWELYYEDLYKTKKNKDGTETRVFDRRAVYARKSKEGDDGASLAKQLGLTGKEADKFAAKIDGGDNVRLSEQGGDVGRVFKAVEEGLTSQVKWKADHPGQRGGPSGDDCSETACRIAFPQQMFGRLSFTVQEADATISAEGAAKSVQESELRIGDIARWADARNNPQHFASFIFRGDDGVPIVFSKSGGGGPFEMATTARITEKYPDYGTIRGINRGDTGFYHPR
jgi:RHS repeat-associated protein